MVEPSIFGDVTSRRATQEVREWWDSFAAFFTQDNAWAEPLPPAPTPLIGVAVDLLREWTAKGEVLACSHVVSDGSQRVNCFPFAATELLCDACALAYVVYQRCVEGGYCSACCLGHWATSWIFATASVGCVLLHLSFCKSCVSDAVPAASDGSS